MLNPPRIGILGGAGRMGRMLLQEVLGRSDAILAGAVEAPGHPDLGRDLGLLVGRDACAVALTEQRGALFASADVVIDFTHPSQTKDHAALAVTHRTALVVGTTGLDEAARTALIDAGLHSAVLWAANMSVGVTLLTRLVQQLSARLDADRYDIEIVEMHHRHKIDAPSGTALALAQAAALGRGVSLDQVASFSRQGQVGARPTGEIGVQSLRGGDVVGDHTVIFAGPGERLEISHKAASRDIFAAGAVRAALWAAAQPPGFYGMHDVLGF